MHQIACAFFKTFPGLTPADPLLCWDSFSFHSYEKENVLGHFNLNLDPEGLNFGHFWAEPTNSTFVLTGSFWQNIILKYPNFIHLNMKYASLVNNFLSYVHNSC